MPVTSPLLVVSLTVEMVLSADVQFVAAIVVTLISTSVPAPSGSYQADAGKFWPVWTPMLGGLMRKIGVAKSTTPQSFVEQAEVWALALTASVTVKVPLF